MICWRLNFSRFTVAVLRSSLLLTSPVALRSGGYEIGGDNTQSCSYQRERLPTPAECMEAAAALGKNYGFTGSYAGWPKDCFMYRDVSWRSGDFFGFSSPVSWNTLAHTLGSTGWIYLCFVAMNWTGLIWYRRQDGNKGTYVLWRLKQIQYDLAIWFAVFRSSTSMKTGWHPLDGTALAWSASVWKLRQLPPRRACLTWWATRLARRALTAQ